MKCVKSILTFTLVASMGLGLTACSASSDTAAADAKATEDGATEGIANEETVAEKNYTVSTSDIAKADISSSGVSVHDPSIVEDNGEFYIFGSHMTAAKSSDLCNWEMLADGYMKTNPVYGQIYDVADEAFYYSGSKDSVIETDDGGTHVWAPDVIYNKTTGKYYMYYCTSSTWNASNLCYGVSDTIEGPYEWQGALIYSGFNFSSLAETDVLDYVDEDYAKKNYIKSGSYNYNDYPNAIDPTVFYDRDDRMWMVYGSWSGGIFLLEIDPETGKVIHPEADPDNGVDAYYGKRLLGGGHISIEGPYIQYDPDSDYYYLYVSYGSLTSNGGYQIRVFRSKDVTGDYVDMNGEKPEKSAMHENYGLKLSGNYKLPSLEQAYMATGHNSALIASDGRKYIAFHTRFNDGGEGHSPRAHQMLLNEEGWPCMLPYQTQGEQVEESGYAYEDVVGRYYCVNQGTDISSDIANPFIVYLNSDGTLDGKDGLSGTWELTDGTYYIHMSVDGVDFSGVLCKMKDEAGTDVFTFSAVGSNESLWGVKYSE